MPVRPPCSFLDLDNRNKLPSASGIVGDLQAGTNENVYERWMYESTRGRRVACRQHQMLGHSAFKVTPGRGATPLAISLAQDEQTIWYTSPDITVYLRNRSDSERVQEIGSGRRPYY